MTLLPSAFDVVGYDPPALHAFAYLSRPAVAFSSRDLSDLLRSARRFNAARDVTGKLVVLEDGDRIVRFAQWIEGPQLELARCIERIVADPRHHEIEARYDGPVDARRFPGWDMAIHSVNEVQFSSASESLVEAA